MKTVETPARNDVELPPAVHWPTVYLMFGIGGGLVAVLAAVGVIAALQPAPMAESVKEVAEVRPAPAPRQAGGVTWPTAAPPTAKAPAEPASAVEWKALVPHEQAPVAAPSAVKHTPQVGIPFAAADVRPVSPAPFFTTPDEAARAVNRLDPLTEDQLRAELQRHSRLIDLDAVEGTTRRLLARKADDERPEGNTAGAPGATADNVADVIARRDDLAGLPLLGAKDCRLSDEETKPVEEISRTLRRLTARRFKPEEADDKWAADAQDVALVPELVKQTKWLKEGNVSVLVQMLQVEGPRTRWQLTKMLTSIQGGKAGVGLARRALFDVSPDLREAAVQALKSRPPEEYRQTLLDGLRYPWPPVAQHAAEALVAVDDRGAIPKLEALLDLPDPAAPAKHGKQKWVVPELVKVNHLRNCLLCHAPSHSDGDFIRGVVPTPGRELPPAYYESRAGDFVRADVTYLREDFSVMEHVGQPDKWPSTQRFDYLVRNRELSGSEASELLGHEADRRKSYPQRQAVQFALDMLSLSQDAKSAAGLGP